MKKLLIMILTVTLLFSIACGTVSAESFVYDETYACTSKALRENRHGWTDWTYVGYRDIYIRGYFPKGAENEGPLFMTEILDYTGMIQIKLGGF